MRERLSDSRNQDFFRHGLSVDRDAETVRARAHRRVIPPREHDSRRNISLGPEVLNKVQPAHSRHVLVNQEAVGRRIR